MMRMKDFTYDLHPEKAIDGFTAIDGTVRFYGFIRAIALKTNAKNVLDFGAGRGAAFLDDDSLYRKYLRDLRTAGATVTACDIDDAVLGHNASDTQVLLTVDRPLPFPDKLFDIIISDMVFEHITTPDTIASELLRVTKTGGYICIRTPNVRGYVTLISRLIPRLWQANVLHLIQPGRKSEDIFPTVYQMNSPNAIRRLFPDTEVIHYYDSAEPAYYANSKILYRLGLLLHSVLPRSLRTSICLFIHKR
jgi:SAM-dependent methyltransferase